MITVDDPLFERSLSDTSRGEVFQGSLLTAHISGRDAVPGAAGGVNDAASTVLHSRPGAGDDHLSLSSTPKYEHSHRR